MFNNIHPWFIEKGVTEKVALAIENSLEILLVILLAVIADFVTKKILVGSIKTFIRKSKTHLDDVLIEHKVFTKLAHLAPALIIYFFIPFIFSKHPEVIPAIQRIALAYMILIGAFFIGALASALLTIYETYEVAIHRPIKGHVQGIKILVYVIAGIFILSTLLNKTPWGLISVLGGLTAILLLLFRDPILGFVASIQLISNRMVSKGDWIEMPKHGADGDVIDVSLTTVKVRNWDKTITTIPTYALVSDSFKNWRGMQESGGRRIKRAIYIDMNSIKFCSDEMLERFKKIEYMKDYLKQKQTEIKEHNLNCKTDTSTLINGRRLTNVGTFRAYIAAYLRNHPKVHQNLTFLIRHLKPTENGLPIEIYVFTNDIEWANYENIQADIFDHILAAAPEFDLRVFQSPSGRDLSRFAESAQRS